jgi:DNA-binding MarR family transcriptional regulator
MEVRASYAEGHLLVAAIRVLSHRQSGRPPTEDEIAQLISVSREWIGVLVSSLEKAGVVRVLTGPFESRVEVLEHLALEKLSKAASTAGVEDDLKEFAAKKREEEEKLRSLFTGEALSRKEKEKMGKLADQFKGYKPKPPKGAPFLKDGEDD